MRCGCFFGRCARTYKHEVRERDCGPVLLMSWGRANTVRVAPDGMSAPSGTLDRIGCARVCSHGLGPCYARGAFPVLLVAIGRSRCPDMSSLTSSFAARHRCRLSSRSGAVEQSDHGGSVVYVEEGHRRISARDCFAAVAERKCRPGYPGRGVLPNACAFPAMFEIGSEPSAEGRSCTRSVNESMCADGWRAWDRPGGRPPRAVEARPSALRAGSAPSTRPLVGGATGVIEAANVFTVLGAGRGYEEKRPASCR